MRLHITLEDRLVEELDSRVGRRGRSSFIAATVRDALEDRRRWDGILASLGTIPDAGHEWDGDLAEWVSAGRREDARRVG